MYGAANNSVQRTDARILEWLINLHSTLNKDKIDLRELNNLVKVLEHYNEDAKDTYINSILYPETVLGAKVPTLFPIPTASFQMHLTNASQNVNSQGNLAWTWNPFWLTDASANGAVENTTFYVNNNTALNGTSSQAFFLPTSLLYNQIPAGVYGSYRVVSASIVVSYIGRLDAASGTLGIGVGVNNAGVGVPQPVTSTTSDPGSLPFSIFSQVDNLFFKERGPAVNGVRAIYFPLDDTYVDFHPLYTASAGPGTTLLNCYNTGFYFAGYAQGLIPGAGSGSSSTNSVLRFDMYINFEALVQPGFNNYIPTSSFGGGKINALETAGDLIQSSPSLIVNKSSDIPGAKEYDVANVTMLEKLMSQSGDPYLPSIDIIKKTIWKK